MYSTLYLAERLQVVIVPIGWPHAVANLCNSLKLAYDGLQPRDLTPTIINYLEVIHEYFPFVQNTMSV